MYLYSKHILEHPICDCYYKYENENPDYGWATIIRNNQLVGLEISCKICKIYIVIPTDRFRAKIEINNFDRERKAGLKEEKNKPNLKVLEFPNPKE